MTLRLRAHHLLCLLTYVGKGYSTEFVANYDRIAARLSAGEEIELVDGPDDICAPLLETTDPHCHTAQVTLRDKIAAQDMSAILSRDLAQGTRLTLDRETLALMRTAFTPQARAACQGCEWSPLCTDIAKRDFVGTRVQFPEQAAI